METELLNMMIVNLPNFVFAFMWGYSQYRLINRLMDKIDDCDCPSDAQQETDKAIANISTVSKLTQ
jgi:hypothetical protein